MGRKHAEHHEEHADETWLVPYADLLTLLLALFIVLFAMGKTDEKKWAKWAVHLMSLLAAAQLPLCRIIRQRRNWCRWIVRHRRRIG